MVRIDGQDYFSYLTEKSQLRSWPGSLIDFWRPICKVRVHIKYITCHLFLCDG